MLSDCPTNRELPDRPDCYTRIIALSAGIQYSILRFPYKSWNGLMATAIVKHFVNQWLLCVVFCLDLTHGLSSWSSLAIPHLVQSFSSFPLLVHGFLDLIEPVDHFILGTVYGTKVD